MRRKIPSTGALLAFEVAGRHENFARAAEELGITEGAVSRQIARLEDYLELILFNRVKGRIHLTDAGREYWLKIGTTLDQIERDTLLLQAQPEKGGILELAVIPTFTNRWIIPRLPKFHAANPNITINMTERPEPFLFAESPFDAAIHYDHPAWAGMIKKELFAEELVPVCSPTLLKSEGKMSLNELKNLPLLHKRGRADAWKEWLSQLGIADVNLMQGARYDLFAMAIEAAKAGLGVALVPRLYIAEDVADGKLVIPFDRYVASQKKYCIVFPERKHGAWPLRVFLDWLIHECDLYVRRRNESVT